MSTTDIVSGMTNHEPPDHENLLGARRSRVRRTVGRFFDPYRLHPRVLDALSEVCRLHEGISSEKDTVLSSAVSRRSMRCIFLLRGCVVVQALQGTPRLWRGRAFFGTSHVWREGTGVLENPQLVTRGAFTALSVPGGVLHDVLAREPTLGMALLRMTFEQQQVMEAVYGASTDAPLLRVAALLDYLATPRPVVVKAEDGRRVVTPQRKLAIEGPSQTDIADCLGLGRATVEKALATLRQEGALRSSTPGKRKNRYYEIADLDHLRLISMGAVSTKIS
ncbi:helix-turn-helix domain-containing protein (plasmid) [Streptomyces cynarae]|uniref:Helix-turn-helix domain-containing protein n=1 Tax=Streptomyces cynarae TaxID=2981134 RepID=A0ABY6EG38_9ACTN|nr:helix-turn-helix domain-containing protein [Streptomyces cynarae]UXY24878.1 helix-turn-helix domain-containing protein [Streptomyces cynarae]